jgi:hypothetical protein
MRGGHQLCIDSDAGKMYLLSGWSGRQDLPDFWEFEIATSTWTCLQRDTFQEGYCNLYYLLFAPIELHAVGLVRDLATKW